MERGDDAVAILQVHRLPMVFTQRWGIEPLDRLEATLFVGRFGPIDVAALFYATLALRETGLGWSGPG